MNEQDVEFETELVRNQYSVKTWVAYLEHKRDAGARDRFVLYERALQLVPGSYKLWHAYVLERRAHARKRGVKSGRHEMMCNLYERCMVFMHKMPRIWIEYCEYLVKCGRVTLARRTFDRALRSLPITQHVRIWKLYASWARACPITETSILVYARYMKLQPDQREDYVALLLERGLKGKAAAQLALIVNDASFVSKKGKSKHTLWMELCTLVSKHPDAAKVAKLNVENLVRAGLTRFTDETGSLWCSLAEYFIRLAMFERARDIYEEAMRSVSTVRDFSLAFDAYAKFEEEMLNAKLQLLDGDDEEEEEEEEEDDVDLRMARLEALMERRPFLLSAVLLRQNPHNVKEWRKRIALFADVPKRLAEYARACKTVHPSKAVQGKVSTLWLEFAKLYEEGGDASKAEFVFEKATAVEYRTVPELASVWCAWAELHIRGKTYDRARALLAEAVRPPDAEETAAWKAEQRRKKAANEAADARPPVSMRLHRSNQLWALHVDVEESIGGLVAARAAYDRMMLLKVSFLSFTVIFHANHAHNSTRSP
jgi:pre-mRNA-splicing factor SYF1